jgi:hypothetical protein
MSADLTRDGFQGDLRLGQFYEGELAKILALGGDGMEIKADHRAIKTGNVFVEFEQPAPGGGRKPSGIKLEPGVDWWSFMLIGQTTVITIHKDRLLPKLSSAPVVRGGDNDQYRGYLLPVKDLVSPNE